MTALPVLAMEHLPGVSLGAAIESEQAEVPIPLHFINAIFVALALTFFFLLCGSDGCGVGAQVRPRVARGNHAAPAPILPAGRNG